MTGDADTVGAGAKVLVKGLVGGTFGSAAKITGEPHIPKPCGGISGAVSLPLCLPDYLTLTAPLPNCSVVSAFLTQLQSLLVSRHQLAGLTVISCIRHEQHIHSRLFGCIVTVNLSVEFHSDSPVLGATAVADIPIGGHYFLCVFPLRLTYVCRHSLC